MKKQIHKFSLIEILLSVGILVIAMISFICLFPIGLEASRAISRDYYLSKNSGSFMDYYDYNLARSLAINKFETSESLGNIVISYKDTPVNEEIPFYFSDGSKGNSFAKILKTEVRIFVDDSISITYSSDQKSITKNHMKIDNKWLRSNFVFSFPISESRYKKREKIRFEKITLRNP